MPRNLEVAIDLFTGTMPGRHSTDDDAWYWPNASCTGIGQMHPVLVFTKCILYWYLQNASCLVDCV